MADTPTAKTSPDAARQELAHWQEMLGQVGRELAEPLTAAMERVATLATTGRIDQSGLRALREEIDRARQAGIHSQQIARLASGRVSQSHERVHLTNTMQSVLANRMREFQAKGLQLSQSLLPIEVQADASMLFSLLIALTDWWMDCARGTLDVRIDVRDWPVRAQLSSSFVHSPLDRALPDIEAITARLNTLHWHLLQQTARAMGLSIERIVNGHKVHLSIEFPGSIQVVLPEPASVHEPRHADNDSAFADSVNARPLAGSHVLVMSGQRDVRIQVREAVRSMGLVLDFVSSVREAIEFCRDGLPHAIVFDSLLRSNHFERLVSDIKQEVPDFVFIELVEGGSTFDVSAISATGMARVGRDGITNALPSALVYELSQVL